MPFCGSPYKSSSLKGAHFKTFYLPKAQTRKAGILGYVPYLISILNYRTNPTFHPIDQTDNICMSIHAADRNASLHRPLCTASVPSHSRRHGSKRAGVAWHHRNETPYDVGCFVSVVSGSYLSFRAVASQVLSAYKGLTSVFGMGTGGTP